MHQNWGGGKCFFKSTEGGATVVREIPRSGFAREAGEQNSNGGIVGDQTMIEVGKTRKD